MKNLEWHPCDECYPEDTFTGIKWDGTRLRCLVTVEDSSERTTQITCRTLDRIYHKGWYWEAEDGDYCNTVIAWMPVPEAYDGRGGL